MKVFFFFSFSKKIPGQLSDLSFRARPTIGLCWTPLRGFCCDGILQWRDSPGETLRREMGGGGLLRNHYQF